MWKRRCGREVEVGEKWRWKRSGCGREVEVEEWWNWKSGGKHVEEKGLVEKRWKEVVAMWLKKELEKTEELERDQEVVAGGEESRETKKKKEGYVRRKRWKDKKEGESVERFT